MDPPGVDCDSMMREAEIDAVLYGSLGRCFGGRLANAALDLSAFVSCPGMKPAVNAV